MSHGVRFVGKDPDGIAKAISVNDDGVLLAELSGSLLVGEVAENPTANTILGRMKSLESKIDTLDVVIDSILAKIIAAPSTEAKQDTIIGYVDGVEAVLANILAKIIASPATEAKQTALNALIGEVQTAPTANTLLARLKSLEDKLAETLTVQLSGSNTRKWATDTITFGAGAGAHNAGDVLSTDTGEILEFDTGLAAGASGIILSSLVTLDQAPFSGGAGYTLHLFTAAPTVIADDAAFVLVAAELSTYIGKIDISTMVTGTNASYALDIGHNLDFSLAAADTKLYGQLVCKGTDTTVNTKVLTINLGIAAL